MKTQNLKAGKALPNAGLLGRFFHSINKDDNQVKWQGVVIGNPEPGWYLVQLFGWLDGSPCDQQLMRIEDFSGWLFYDDSETMRFSYDHGSAREGGPHRKRVTEN
jgi:hypothetical protein